MILISIISNVFENVYLKVKMNLSKGYQGKRFYFILFIYSFIYLFYFIFFFFFFFLGGGGDTDY